MTRRPLVFSAVAAGTAFGCAVIGGAACASFGSTTEPALDASAVDATTGDGSGSVDAAGDAGVDPCGDRSTPAAFTASFDESASPWGFDDLVRISNTGVAELDVTTGGGLDGRALLVSVREGPSTSHNTWLRKGFPEPGGARRIRLDFDFILQEAGHDYALLGGLFFDSSGPVKDFALAERARGAQLDEGNAGGLSIGAPWLTQGIVGVAHHAVICVLREPATTNVRRIVRVDDTAVDDRAGLALGDITRFELRIGVFYTSYEDVETRVLYDDVEVRVD